MAGIDNSVNNYFYLFGKIIGYLFGYLFGIYLVYFKNGNFQNLFSLKSEYPLLNENSTKLFIPIPIAYFSNVSRSNYNLVPVSSRNKIDSQSSIMDSKTGRKAWDT